jgi:hypothetical protein
MKNRVEPHLACPALLSPAARILAATGVLATMALVGLLVVDSSEVAVERKLAEFETAPSLAQGGAPEQPGEARVPVSALGRYHAALPEVETVGCDRTARRPG